MMKNRIKVQDIFAQEGFLSADALLPAVASLSDRYTSRESSSVTYETANMLMEAVLYCIQECLGESEHVMTSDAMPEPLVLYEKGYEAVLAKVKSANALYEELIKDFTDYGCRNYGDTVLKGMPAFFLKYDARFCPQDHIITLDYPLLAGDLELCGVDQIHDYLHKLLMEKRFLGHFDKAAVSGLLSELCPEYGELYLDNICRPVLSRAAECLILDKPLTDLRLSNEEKRELQEYFTGMDREKIRDQKRALAVLLAKKTGVEEEYFRAAF